MLNEDLKSDYKGKFFSIAHVMQAELCAFLFDFAAIINNIPLRISYTKIMYYYTEEIEGINTKFTKTIKIERNSKFLLMPILANLKFMQ